MTKLSKIEDLFREHYTFLCVVAENVVEDDEIAKDIVQNFFLYCLNNISVLNITLSFKAYAFRAVKNAALSYIKKPKKVLFNDDLLVETMAELHSSEKDHELDTRRDADLWEIIGRMPEKRRLIFLLSNKDGLKYAEIAAQLDISVNTVKTHIKLSYEYLRRECRTLIRVLILILMGGN